MSSASFALHARLKSHSTLSLSRGSPTHCSCDIHFKCLTTMGGLTASSTGLDPVFEMIITVTSEMRAANDRQISTDPTDSTRSFGNQPLVNPTLMAPDVSLSCSCK